MKFWKIAAACAAMITAAGIGAAFAPVANGQTVVRRAQPDRGVGILTTGGGRIGISLREVDEDDVKSGRVQGIAGAVIEDVSEGSPAEKAGMKKGDVIVEFDGERVRSVRQLTRLVQETPEGRKVQTALMRGGQRVNVTVEPQPGNRWGFEGLRGMDDFHFDLPTRIAPTPPARLALPRAPEAWRFEELLGRTGRLGISVDTLSPQLAEYFGTKEGALVTTVQDDSAAAKAGLKAGDVITSLNGSTVDEPSDVRRLIQNLEDGQEFTIGVMRDRKPQTLKGKVERTERRRTYRTIL